MRVILAYKNFAANRHISHIGLGVAAINTCKTLQKNGIQCDVWPIIDGNDLRRRLNLDYSNPVPNQSPVTNVVISAPWLPTHALNQLSTLFPRIQFAMNCHSNVGFLQADTNGMRLVREALELELAVPNFTVAANSRRLCEWVLDAYGNHCQRLPNLYYVEGIDKQSRPLWNGGTLRLGVFGATRPQKNVMSAVGAAIELSFQLKAETEIWISSGRQEGGGTTILNTVREAVRGLPMVQLKEAGWNTWPQFRRLVGSMHLLLQPSYTESFNMVTADGIVEGVPSVVSDAIDWAPEYWKADVDDVFDIAHTGRALLSDPKAAKEGMHALNSYLDHGIRSWKKWLGIAI